MDKTLGPGRVFYNSLGHVADIIAMPEVSLIMKRGFLWAAQGKALNAETKKLENAYSYTGMGDSQ